MRLHEQRDMLAEKLEVLESGLHDLRLYLISDKFADDNMVNVSDVLLRITEMKQKMWEVE